MVVMGMVKRVTVLNIDMKKKTPTKKRITNEDIMKELGEIRRTQYHDADWQSTHEVEDNNRFQKGEDRMNTLAKDSDLKEISAILRDEKGNLNFATKKDVEEVLEAFHTFINALTITKGVGKWTFRSVVTLSVLTAALMTIFGGWKGLLMMWPWWGKG